ncbi:Leucine-rich PPR motif-containing protein, mitochondrial [Habropoda laboriosa]|uniref:Leucine-rich PPR motif-containing protein, mitochondrial n=1 Tax=Habropoda laboriosa TaxID=597456 RepID=A0A0L7QZW8_9HYME|nr:Leucine-rich PPR motif-containing protein, mitochondrial [Habropoda laboriosa]
MENNNFNISQTLSIMLLHCCGKALYNEPLKIRQELVNRIWNLLKAKEYKLTIDHYHALLQTYIDNDYTIDSNQFLQNMTIFPEYDTYCLLLQVPSTDNCAFADSILLKIQQNTLPADKKIYNALMYAYAINGDIEEVHKIIELVQKETIEPLSAVNDIYLMYALAKNGDNKTLIKTLKNTKLSISDMLKLVKLLSLSKNDLCIKGILKCAQSLVTEEEEVCSAITLLVHAGHIMDAYKIAAYIPINTEFQNIRKILVLCLFKQVIKLNVDPETILKLVHNFKTKDFTLDIWAIVNQCALEENNDTLTFRILDEMKAMGIIINFDHVRPLCLHMQKCNNETDIYSIIRKMIALNNTINSDMIFLNYVFPVINTRDPIAAILKMQEHGINTKENCKIDLYINPQYMNSEQLYLHFHELKNDNKNFRGIARKLLMVSCKENNVKVVEELLENIKYNNFEWTPGMKMCLLDFYVKRGMIEEALHTVDEIQCQFQHSIIDNCKILELVMQLVKLNKVNEACNVIQKLNNHPNDIRKMMNLLFERGYWRNHELEYLILAQILENNTDVVTNQIKEDSLLNELRYLKKEDIITITSTILETHNIISKSCLKSMYNLTLSIYDEQGDYERALELKTKMNSKYNTQCNL